MNPDPKSQDIVESMKSPAVSIIIAAFNSEKYIQRCVDSIASQTMRDFEVILIDDGSTDRTGQICEEYVQKDSRFHVFHQANQGVAAARQKGLDLSQGEYTIHVDADDWIEPDMLKKMYESAEEESADMVICDYIEHFRNGTRYNSQEPAPKDRLSIFGQMMNNLSGGLTNKLIRRSCYLQYGITFDNDVHFEEDKLVCLKLLSHPISVSYIPVAFYHYDHTQNPLSLSNVGVFPDKRMLVLEKIEEYTNIKPVQQYFDNAIFYIAYQAFRTEKNDHFDFSSCFRRHLPSIRRAKGFPFYTKWLVLLRLHHIRIPYRHIKRILSHDS